MTTSADDLLTREGLPADLLWMLQACPRATWDRAHGLRDLGAFWLDRHHGFREAWPTLVSLAGQASDDRAKIARYLAAIDLVLRELDAHHRIEDEHYFPQLAQLEPRLARGFGLLDADHHLLEGAIAKIAELASAARQALRESVAGHGQSEDQLLERLEQFRAPLLRHLEDEEDLVIPLLIKLGA